MDELLTLAATQFGVFTRAQAGRCGLRARQLRYRVEAGFFEQLGYDVFRVRGTEETWHQRVIAACLLGGHECVASHRTAAMLHEFDLPATELVEVTVPRKRRLRTELAVVHQSLDLCPADCCTVDGIPVTTPARTLIDLGAVHRWARVEESFDGAERDRLVERDTVARRHAQVRKQGRRGVGAMAVVLEARDSGTPHSVLERRFLRLLEDANLPRPVCQFPLALPGGRTIYLDTSLPDLRLAWELDGQKWHATRSQRAHDNRRQIEIENLGWRVDRFTYEQVTQEGTLVVALVRAAIESRISCDAT